MKLSRFAGIAMLAAAWAIVWFIFHRRDAKTRSDAGLPEIVVVHREVRVEPVAGTARYRVRLLKIPNLPGQRVLSEDWNEPPTESGTDPAGDWVGWDIVSPAGSSRVFSGRTRVELQNAGLSATPRSLAPDPDPSGFLGSDTFRQVGDASISQIAASIGETDTLSRLEGIWDAVIAKMRYGGYDPDSRGAVYAATSGVGDCTEFADLFVATARSLGIPARRMDGWTLAWKGTPRHAWVEAWIPSRGWTAFDPTWGESGSATFERLSTTRIVASWNPSSAAIEHRSYGAWRWWGDSPSFVWRDSLWTPKTSDRSE